MYSAIFTEAFMSQDAAVKPAAFGVTVNSKVNDLTRIASTCWDGGDLTNIEGWLALLKIFLSADMNRRVMQGSGEKIMGKKVAVHNDQVNGSLGNFTGAVIKLGTGENKEKLGGMLKFMTAGLADADAVTKRLTDIVAEWKQYAEKLGAKRGGDIVKVMQKEVQVLTGKINDIPSPVGTKQEEDDFIQHMQEEKISDLVNKSDGSLQQARKSIADAFLTDKYQEQLDAAKPDVDNGRVLIASMGVLALLQNKFLTAKSTKGETLRSQLQSLKDIINHEEHPLPVHASIKKRMEEVWKK